MDYLVKIRMKVNTKKKIAKEYSHHRKDQDILKYSSEKNLFSIKENFHEHFQGCTESRYSKLDET